MGRSTWSGRSEEVARRAIITIALGEEERVKITERAQSPVAGEPLEDVKM